MPHDKKHFRIEIKISVETDTELKEILTEVTGLLNTGTLQATGENYTLKTRVTK